MFVLNKLDRPLYQFANIYRKNYSGFIRNRTIYLQQPSLGLMKSLSRGIDRLPKDSFNKRKYFLNCLGEHHDTFVPWHSDMESTNYYFHVKVNDPENMLKVLSHFGYCAMPQQSFFVDPSQAPKAYQLKEHLIILPCPDNLSFKELVEMSNILKIYN